MVKIKFTIKVSGHILEKEKIGGDLNDCIWKLNKTYFNAKKPPEILKSEVLAQWEPNQEKMDEISKYFNEIYLVECNRLLSEIKYNEQGIEV